MTTTKYLTKAQYSAAKARLTRAVNSGDHQKVLLVVAQTFAAWNDGDYAYPDDWHRWERAVIDAEMALSRANFDSGGFYTPDGDEPPHNL